MSPPSRATSRQRRPRPQRRRPRDLPQLRHDHSLGRSRVVRLATPLGRRDQSARPDPAGEPVQRARDHPAPRRRVDVLRRRQPARQRSGGTGQRGPVRHRARLAQRSRRGASAEGRHRGSEPLREEPRSSSARMLAANWVPRERLRWRRRPNSSANRWVKDELVRGRPVTRRQPRVAGRLRVHKGTRRAGAHRSEGQRPGLDRATVDHRVRVGRAEARAGSAASGWPNR